MPTTLPKPAEAEDHGLEDRGPAAPTLEGLYEAHGKAVYRYLLGMLGRPDDAEDAMQSLWVELCRRWHELQRPEHYLWRMARNEAISRRRRFHWWRSRATDADAELGMLSTETEGGPSRDQRLDLVRALGRLRFTQREAVVAMAFEGWSAREAAERLGLSESTLDSRYRTALRKLRRHLAPVASPIGRDAGAEPEGTLEGKRN